MVKVFLLKNVARVGMAGEIIKVADGYAANYLVPHKLGIIINDANEAMYKNRIKVIENRKEIVESATSMLAEKIKSLKCTIKRKLHDDGKLYGSINPAEIVDVLAEQGVNVGKSQIVLEKSIKEKGTYDVVVKLSSRLQPTFSLKVVGE
jgi:large subunit ribosomal protein L9